MSTWEEIWNSWATVKEKDETGEEKDKKKSLSDVLEARGNLGRYMRYFFGEVRSGDTEAFTSRCVRLVASAASPDHLAQVENALIQPPLSIETVESERDVIVKKCMGRLRAWMLALRFVVALKVAGEERSRCEQAFAELCAHYELHLQTDVRKDVREILEPHNCDVAAQVTSCFECIDTPATWPHEVLDLCLFLLAADLTGATHTVPVTAVGADKTQTYIPEMRFERVTARGIGFTRHPLSFLLQTDTEFDGCFVAAQTFLGGGFEWRGAHHIDWQDCVLRWHLTTGKGELPWAHGGSIGGVIGVGAILTLADEQTDPHISITSQIDEKGDLVKFVDGIEDKLPAFAQRKGDTIIVSPQQDMRGLDVQGLNVERHNESKKLTSILDAALLFANRGEERKNYLQAVKERCERVEVVGSGKIKLRDIYIATPVVEVVEMEVRESSPSERSAERENRTPLREMNDSTRRYEEALRTRKTVEQQTFSLDQWIGTLGQNQKLYFFYGPPGSGKTTLLSYIATRLSDPEWSIETKAPKIPVFIRLKAWANKRHLNLHDYLALTAVHEPSSSGKPVAEAEASGGIVIKAPWERWIKRGELLLLLDGLDEIDDDAVHKVKDLIDNNPACTWIVTCRTVSSLDRFGEIRRDVGKATLPIYTPADISREGQRGYLEAYRDHVVPDTQRSLFKPEELLDHIDKVSNIGFMATNPLLLSLLCYLVNENLKVGKQVKDLPVTRVGLYEEVVARLIDQMRGN